MEAQEFDKSDTVMSRVRRYAAAGVLAVGLVASGVAVVAAASPDPSASPTPQSTSSTKGNGGSGGAGASPSTGGQTGTHANCPKDQSSSSTGSTTTQ